MVTTKTRAPRKAAKKKKSLSGSLPRNLPKNLTKSSTALARRPQPKTLVTGGTGFLGSHLMRQLIEEGAKNLRVLTTGAPAWLAALDVEIVEGSLTDAPTVARAVEGVGEIYHLAGRVSREKRDAREMYSIHVDGTRLLCEAASASGVKSIVMASTSGTIAVTEKGLTIPDEENPAPLDIVTRWPYYASKVYQERVALEYFNGKDQRLVMLNPSLLLGPGDERLSSTKVILDFLARKINAVPTGGLSFVDVRDAAAAFRAAMKSGRHGERYLLGAVNWTFEKFFARLERQTKIAAPRISLPKSIAVTGAQLFDAVFRQWNYTPPIEVAAVEMAEYFWYLDSTKARRELSFNTRDPAETLHDTVAYLRENFLGGDAFSKN
jgi:dihydroflavonol-4-reductase